MRKVFLYVGHSNWGKSYTLKEITAGNSYIHKTIINGQEIIVRKRSNDDSGIKLLEWVKKPKTTSSKRLIIAFCPKTKTKPQNAFEILDELKKNSELYFFIQHEKYQDSNSKITDVEINYLKKYGKIHTLYGQHEYPIRASEFINFIKVHI